MLGVRQGDVEDGGVEQHEEVAYYDAREVSVQTSALRFGCYRCRVTGESHDPSVPNPGILRPGCLSDGAIGLFDGTMEAWTNDFSAPSSA